MENFSAVNDVLDFAIENEAEAVKFYTELAAKMDNASMEQVFLDFANEERGHKRLLEDAKAGKKVNISEENIADLKIAEFTVAVQPTADMDYKSALILAMQKEKKAFQLYTALANLVDELDAQQLFSSLAQQEAKHKLRFELEYDEVVLKED